MNKTAIEWVKNPDGSQGYTINPVKGLCPMDCKDNEGKPYCYARRMYKRFGWNPEIRYIAPGFTIDEISRIKKPSRIFWGSTMELFGPWVPDLWLKDTFEIVRQFPQHTHIFLTKQPSRVIKFMGGNPDFHSYKKAQKFPSNVHLGVTITSNLNASIARDLLQERLADVNFLSIEPLLGRLDKWSLANVVRLAQWVIIGQQTPVKASTEPKREWIEEIETAAREEGIAIFEKNNLAPLLGRKLIQEVPA